MAPQVHLGLRQSWKGLHHSSPSLAYLVAGCNLHLGLGTSSCLHHPYHACCCCCCRRHKCFAWCTSNPRSPFCPGRRLFFDRSLTLSLAVLSHNACRLPLRPVGGCCSPVSPDALDVALVRQAVILTLTWIWPVALSAVGRHFHSHNPFLNACRNLCRSALLHFGRRTLFVAGVSMLMPERIQCSGWSVVDQPPSLALSSCRSLL